MSDKTTKSRDMGPDKYPGADMDIGTENEATPSEVKDDVEELNNNPRITDDKMP